MEKLVAHIHSYKKNPNTFMQLKNIEQKNLQQCVNTQRIHIHHRHSMQYQLTLSIHIYCLPVSYTHLDVYKRQTAPWMI